MGATFSIYGGLIMAVLLVTFSPVVSGTPTSLVSSANFEWFLLRNPWLISIPSRFLYGFVGTLISKELHPAGRCDELSVRAFYRSRSREGSGSPRAPDLTRSEVSSDRQNRTSLVVFVPTVAAESTRNPPIRPPDRHLSKCAHRHQDESAVIRTRRSPL
jgi:hypothetical protein